MKKIIFYAILVLFFSCKQNETIHGDDLHDNQVKVLHIERYSANGIISYAHYLYISDTGSSDSVLIKKAQDYVNALTSNKPVFVLTFVNSRDGFSQSPEDNDLDEIRKNTIAEIYYTSLSDKQGKFEKITREGIK